MGNSEKIIFSGGNFCNQLYYVLQAFIRNKKYVVNARYLNQEKLYSQLIDFLGERGKKYILPPNYSAGATKESSYKQSFGRDFTLKSLNGFISEIILQSKYIKNRALNEDSFAVHIRNGDYLLNNNKHFNCFNSKEYLESACQIARRNFSNITKIKVVSNDNTLNMIWYDQILHKYFNKVEYIFGNTSNEDFSLLSLSKHKILWNSTYSYWSSFISNVIFKESESCIICPSKTTTKIPASDRCNPKWVFVGV